MKRKNDVTHIQIFKDCMSDLQVQIYVNKADNIHKSEALQR